MRIIDRVLISKPLVVLVNLVLPTNSVSGQRPPLTVVSLLDLARIFFDLHHVDLGQIVLHFLKVFATLAINDVENLLNFARAHLILYLMRRLAYRRKMI